MVFLSKRIWLLCAFMMMGCNLFDDDKEEKWSQPGFIFKCLDDRGCGYGDDELVWGEDEFGPVYLDREFAVYYGSARLSGGDAGDLSESIREDDDIDVFSASSVLISDHPFYAVRPGKCAIIATNEHGKVIDYTFVTARSGGVVYDKNTDDIDSDTGEQTDDIDTGTDSDRYLDSETIDTESTTDTDSDSAWLIDSDTWDLWDGGLDAGDGGDVDTQSDTPTDTETDSLMVNDAGVDTAVEMDAGVRGVGTDEGTRVTR